MPRQLLTAEMVREYIAQSHYWADRVSDPAHKVAWLKIAMGWEKVLIIIEQDESKSN
jgi:hypothetical protein